MNQVWRANASVIKYFEYLELVKRVELKYSHQKGKRKIIVWGDRCVN